MGNAHHAHPGITLGVAVGRELFQVCSVVLGGNGRVVGPQSRLLGQLAGSGLRQILIGPYETAGKRPTSLERRLAPAYRERAQGVTAHGQHDQVHSDGEGRKG